MTEEKKINKNDKGKITISIYKQKKIVIMEFEEKVKWLGLSKNEAQDLGKLLIKQAKKI